MGKLVFYYGPMGCSKTANALMTRFQHLERRRNVWFINPATDTRSDFITHPDGKVFTEVKSRIGLRAEAEVIDEVTDIYKIFTSKTTDNKIDLVICDEVQFLTEKQIEQLRCIASDYSADVVCYGLKTDFTTRLFPGSKRLIELADKLCELKSVCSCGNKATLNVRVDEDGYIITKGSQVEIGGNEKYKIVCHSCYTKALQGQQLIN